MAWDASSHKYLRRGTLNGRPVQMLLDTGCDRTMVSAKLVEISRVDKECKVFFVHMVTLFSTPLPG